MSELFKIVLTASITIVFGILVFVIERFLLFYFIEPIQRQKEMIGKVINTMIFHAHFFANPGNDNLELREKAREDLRKCATELNAKTYVIPWYGLFSNLKIILPKKDIIKICKNLIGLSNGIFITQPDVQTWAIQNLNLQKEIEEILKIEHI